MSDVEANIAPTASGLSDDTFLHGTTGKILTWNPSDPNIGTSYYNISINGTTTQEGTWVSAGQISINITHLELEVGTYFILLNFTDGYGLWHSDEVQLNIQFNEAPATTAQVNLIFVTGNSTVPDLTWTLTDDTTQSPYYTISKNGEVIRQLTWATDDAITYDVSNFAVVGGITTVYTVVITVYDGYGKEISDTVTITVQPNDIPSIESTGNVFYYEGDPALDYSIIFTVTDDTVDQAKYSILVNGSYVEVGTWTSETALPAFNVSLWAKGVYNIELRVSDGYGINATLAGITVTVGDNIIPIISFETEDFTFVYGNVEDQLVEFTVTDTTTGVRSYILYRDNVEIDTGSWTSGLKFAAVNMKDLAVGTYNISIVVSDGYEESATTYVLVTISSNADPVVNSLTDLIFVTGNTTVPLLTWTITDSNIGTTFFNISIDGSTLYSGVWTSGVSLTDVDVSELSVGTHTILVRITDGCDVWIQDEVTVEILTNNIPAINEIADLTFVTGNTTVPLLIWTITDLTTDVTQYNITINSAIPSYTGSWTHNVALSALNVSGFAAGEYTITLTVSDGYGVTVSTNIHITVVPNDTPTITPLNDRSYVEGDPATYTVTWKINDNLIDETGYEIRVDGELAVSGTWESGVFIGDFDISHKSAGTYTIVILATDGYGFSVSDTFILTVQENDTPQITNVADKTYVFGDLTTYSVVWTATDALHGTTSYILTVDGEVVGSANNWVSGNTLPSFDITNWTVGVYEIVMNVSDGYGLSISDTVILTVSANIVPVISGVSDLTFITGNTTVPLLVFTITDSNTATTFYNISVDGALQASNTWTSGVPLTSVDVSGLAVGTHTVVIYCNDGYLVSSTQTFTIIVLANNDPIVSTPEDVNYVFGYY